MGMAISGHRHRTPRAIQIIAAPLEILSHFHAAAHRTLGHPVHYIVITAYQVVGKHELISRGAVLERLFQPIVLRRSESQRPIAALAAVLSVPGLAARFISRLIPERIQDDEKSVARFPRVVTSSLSETAGHRIARKADLSGGVIELRISREETVGRRICEISG